MSAYDVMAHHRETFELYSRTFESVFGTALRHYFDKFTGFDLVRFCEQRIDDADDQSYEEAVRAKYGDVGVGLIKALITATVTHREAPAKV